MTVARIVGVDCATDPKRTGIATCLMSAGTLQVESVAVGGDVLDVVESVVAPDVPVLLALDAPLGWPAPMGNTLAVHRAGGPVPVPPDEMFNRDTDREVRRAVGKKPLEIGADRIARTALATLGILEKLRHATGLNIPLAWAPARVGPMAAIEVYPAATLLSHGISPAGYKAPADRNRRRELIDLLAPRVAIGEHAGQCIASADALDAVVCLLAGRDFLDGNCIPPDDPERAQREGWIWVKRMPETTDVD